MVTVRGGRVREVTRNPGTTGDWMGETVGFTRIPASLLPELRSHAARIEDGDYEIALDRLVKIHTARAVRVDNLPWTEIDFPEDMEAARRICGLARMSSPTRS